MNSVLAMYDISGIQNYIYATKVLKENVGASNNIYELFKEFLPSIIRKKVKNKVKVIYIGGGNAMVSFSDEETYHSITKKLKIHVAEEMPSIYIATAGVFYKENDSFKEVNRQLVMALAKVKRSAERTMPVNSYPITRNFDKVPLENPEIDITKYYSKERKNKLLGYEQAQLNDQFEVEFNQMVQEKGVNSFMAVVHIDGNGMGKLIQAKAEECSSIEKAFEQLSELSNYLTTVYAEARKYVQDAFCKKFEERVKEKKKIPFRMIVGNGDDITFVCQAKYAFDASRLLIQHLEKNTEKLPLTACAGIAFVNAKFPFNRAYEIAEECCRQAKKCAKYSFKIQSYMDCYLVQDGMIQSVSEQWENYNEKSNYSNEGGRPWLISKNGMSLRDNKFSKFCELRDKLILNQKTKWNRSRLIQLRNLFLLGDKETFIKEAKTRGYDLEDNFCNWGLLYDVLELMDFYEPLIEEDIDA